MEVIEVDDILVVFLEIVRLNVNVGSSWNGVERMNETFQQCNVNGNGAEVS